MSKLWQKIIAFLKLLRRVVSGAREDGPYWGYLPAIRWHSIAVRNQIRHYLNRPGVFDAVRLPLLGYEHPIWLRPGTSDHGVYRQVFAEREYAGLDGVRDVGFILDCGANVGLASVYLLNRFPRAKVLAVEPDPNNFAACQRNLRPYGERATLLQGGVWSSRCRLVVVPSKYGYGDTWGIQVRPFRHGDDPGAAVEAFDIPALMTHAGVDRIDILKIDIERSELPLFQTNPDRWLPGVRNLVIELHGDDCSSAFFSAMERYQYQLSHRGDLTYCLDLGAAQENCSVNGGGANGSSQPNQ